MSCDPSAHLDLAKRIARQHCAQWPIIDRDDALGTAFEALVRGAKRVDETRDARAYLSTVIRNALRDFSVETLKGGISEQGRVTTYLTTLDPDSDAFAYDAGLEAQIDARRELARRRTRPPRNERAVTYLKLRAQGLGFSEIARRCGVSRQAVHQAIQREAAA
jgi:RNA polymerase sigma factor (sigma-70 family)